MHSILFKPPHVKEKYTHLLRTKTFRRWLCVQRKTNDFACIFERVYVLLMRFFSVSLFLGTTWNGVSGIKYQNSIVAFNTVFFCEKIEFSEFGSRLEWSEPHHHENFSSTAMNAIYDFEHANVLYIYVQIMLLLKNIILFGREYIFVLYTCRVIKVHTYTCVSVLCVCVCVWLGSTL